jgi:3-methylcrotonyl-CoA carboxylase alpha subunit
MSQDPATTVRFQKVLVANRGEIARRIFRTLREMGLETVAVFSDADRDASFVSEADEAVYLGPAPSTESYLDQDAVVAAAKAAGAGAVHPGYGFLAENARFAERCGEEGLVFIGPSAEAIRRMGNKTEAKALAGELGLPVVAGFAVAELAEDAIRKKADDLGYPLLVKAAAGGGGKGMRVVSTPSDLGDALAALGNEGAKIIVARTTGDAGIS